MSPQGCPSGPFPASSFAPDLSNFAAAGLGRGRFWQKSPPERGLGCSQSWELLVLPRWEQQHWGESVLLQKKLYTQEEGSGALRFVTDVVLLHDLKCPWSHLCV